MYNNFCDLSWNIALWFSYFVLLKNLTTNEAETYHDWGSFAPHPVCHSLRQPVRHPLWMRAVYSACDIPQRLVRCCVQYALPDSVGKIEQSTEFKLWCFYTAECGFEFHAVTLVSLSKTLTYCFVLRMGKKAVGPMFCVTHVKEPSALIEKRRGSLVFLAVAAKCAVAPCKPL